jgi:hypothetical protein
LSTANARPEKGHYQQPGSRKTVLGLVFRENKGRHLASGRHGKRELVGRRRSGWLTGNTVMSVQFVTQDIGQSLS